MEHSSYQRLQKREGGERKDHESELPPKASMATKLTTSFLLSLLINAISTKHPGLPTAHWCQMDYAGRGCAGLIPFNSVHLQSDEQPGPFAPTPH